MSNALETYITLWREKEDRRDSEKCKVFSDHFDQKLDKLGLSTEDKIVLSNLNLEVSVAFEEQGFITGFQMASRMCRMCRELFEASLVNNL